MMQCKKGSIGKRGKSSALSKLRHEYLYTLSKKPYSQALHKGPIPAQESHIYAKEPCNSAKELYISAKKPCIRAKKPCISGEEPYVRAKEPYVSAKEP